LILLLWERMGFAVIILTQYGQNWKEKMAARISRLYYKLQFTGRGKLDKNRRQADL
jgi:hypothetical protein